MCLSSVIFKIFFSPGASAHINFNKLIIHVYKGSGKKKRIVREKDTNRCILIRFQCVVLLSEETLRGGKGDVDLTS